MTRVFLAASTAILVFALMLSPAMGYSICSSDNPSYSTGAGTPYQYTASSEALVPYSIGAGAPYQYTASPGSLVPYTIDSGAPYPYTIGQGALVPYTVDAGTPYQYTASPGSLVPYTIDSGTPYQYTTGLGTLVPYSIEMGAPASTLECGEVRETVVEPEVEVITPVEPEVEVITPVEPEVEVITPVEPEVEVITPVEPEVEVITPVEPEVEVITPVEPEVEVITPVEPEVEANTTGDNTTVETPKVPPEPVLKDIVETATDAGQFNGLVTAVQTANLVDTLSGEGPFTVFAPKDEAFKSISVNETERLAEILEYHVVEGKIMSSDLVDGMPVVTLQGGKLTISVTDEGVTINDANITRLDIECSNGVIHVIDAVLSP